MEGPVVRFRLITLDEIELRRGEATRIAFHPAMLCGYAAFGMLVALMASTGLRGALGGTSHVVGYAAGCAAAVGFIILTLRLAEARAKGGKAVVVNGSLTCFIAALLGLVAGETAPILTSGISKLTFVEGLVLALFFYGVIELVMVFLAAYVLPRVLASLRHAPPAAAEPAAPAAPPSVANLPAVPADARPATLPKRPAGVLRVGSARVPIGDLRRIEAEGNYVHVTTAEGRKLLPGPFSQLVGQLPGTAGQVISRSCWVAAGAIVAHRREGRHLFLLLEDGTEAKVAATRRDEVTAWLRSNGIARPLQAG